MNANLTESVKRRELVRQLAANGCARVRVDSDPSYGTVTVTAPVEELPAASLVSTVIV